MEYRNVFFFFFHWLRSTKFCLVCSISLYYLFSIIDKVLSRARASVVITVCSSSQKESEIIKIEWHLHFSTIFFYFTCSVISSFSPPSLSLFPFVERRWFRLPIDRREREREREKRSLKSWQTVAASSSSFSSSCFIFSISFSLLRLVFTSYSFSECYFLCDGSSRSKKWFPHPSLLLLLLSRPTFCSDVV